MLLSLFSFNLIWEPTDIGHFCWMKWSNMLIMIILTYPIHYFRLPLQVSTCILPIYSKPKLRRKQRSVLVLYYADSGLGFPGSSSNLFSQLLSNQSSNFTFPIPPISFHPRGGSSFLLLPSLPPPPKFPSSLYLSYSQEVFQSHP